MIKKDDNNQKFLRKLDHFDWAGKRMIYQLVVVLYVLFTCIILAGTVTLENALHRMSTQTGVIVWDTIWGCVVFSLLFLLALGMGNRPIRQGDTNIRE